MEKNLQEYLTEELLKGGVLSPTLWNLDINEGLEEMAKDSSTEKHTFADDIGHKKSSFLTQFQIS